MPVKPDKLLANSLSIIKRHTKHGIYRSKPEHRLDVERLIRLGWLSRIIRGWYLFCRPTDRIGETTAWYASYWNFVALYLNDRFGRDYCLNASSSLMVHIGATSIPNQLLVMVKKGGSSV